MAIDKLTLFEMHFDGAQFGPKSTGGSGEAAPGFDAETDEETAADETTGTDEESSGRGRKFLLLFGASVLLSVVATAVARRMGDDEGQTTVDEFDDGETDVAVEHVEDEPRTD